MKQLFRILTFLFFFRQQKLCFCLVCLLLASCAGASYAQNVGLKIEAKYMTGIISDPENQYQTIINDFIRGFEVSAIFPARKPKEWRTIYNKPDWGVAYQHRNLSNPEVLGTSNCLYTFLRYYFIRKKKFAFSIKPGIGLSYQTKVNHRTDNCKNTFFSLHLSNFVSITAELHFKPSPRTGIFAGIDMLHISNGMRKIPNGGMNIPSIHIGCDYRFGTIQNESRQKPLPDLSKRNHFAVNWLFGHKQQFPDYENNYHVSTVYFEAGRKINRVQQLGCGMDWFYDTSSNSLAIGELGVHLSHDVKIGDLYFITQFGAYFVKSHNRSQAIFSRFGLRYEVYQHFIISFLLKTVYHYSVDHIGWGIGYKF